MTSVIALRRHVSQYGKVNHFDMKHDQIGQALGILSVEFSNHHEAKLCVERENGRKGGISNAVVSRNGEVEEWHVVFDDAERSVAAAVEKEVARVKAEKARLEKEKLERERVERERRQQPHPSLPAKPAVVPQTPQTPGTPNPTSYGARIGERRPTMPTRNEGSYVRDGKERERDRGDRERERDYRDARDSRDPAYRDRERERERKDEPTPTPTTETGLASLHKAREERRLREEQEKEAARRAEQARREAQSADSVQEVRKESEEGEGKKEEVVSEADKKEREEVLRCLRENGHDYLEVYLPIEARRPPLKESLVREIFEKKCITPAKVSLLEFSF